jgi:hypothetical protein
LNIIDRSRAAVLASTAPFASPKSSKKTGQTTRFPRPSDGRGWPEAVRAALDGVDLAAEVADVDADVAQVIGEHLGSAFG